MRAKHFDPAQAERAWLAFNCDLGIAAIRTRKQYERTVALMNLLLDVVSENECHPLAGLLDLVGELVAAYDARTQEFPEAPPREVLRFLMEQNDLAQPDLRAELGGQSVVSEVLADKREINARQAKALAARLRVSPAAFL